MLFLDDGVHFPVPEPCAVGLRVPLVYHHPVHDGRVGCWIDSFDVLHPVPATLVEIFPFSATPKFCIFVLRLIADISYYNTKID